MPNNKYTEQLEKDAAKLPVTDFMHQPDQSHHQAAIHEVQEQKGKSLSHQKGQKNKH